MQIFIFIFNVYVRFLEKCYNIATLGLSWEQN